MKIWCRIIEAFNTQFLISKGTNIENKPTLIVEFMLNDEFYELVLEFDDINERNAKFVDIDIEFCKDLYISGQN